MGRSGWGQESELNRTESRRGRGAGEVEGLHSSVDVPSTLGWAPNMVTMVTFLENYQRGGGHDHR